LDHRPDDQPDPRATATDSQDDALARLAFEAAPVGLACVAGAEDRFVAVNPRLCILLGATPADLLGRPLAEMRDADAGMGLPGEAAEQCWRRLDQGTVWLRVRVSEREGRRVLVVEPAEDGRAAARAEQTRLALASAGLGDWSWNAASRQVTLSERAAEILGLPAGPSISWDSLQDLLHRDDVERARAVVQDAVAEGRAYAVEFRYGRPRVAEGQEAAARQELAQRVHVAQGRVLPEAGPAQDAAMHGIVDRPRDGVVERHPAADQDARAQHLEDRVDGQREGGDERDAEEGRLVPARQHPVVDLQHVQGANKKQYVDEKAEHEGRYEHRAHRPYAIFQCGRCLVVGHANVPPEYCRLAIIADATGPSQCPWICSPSSRVSRDRLSTALQER
jgi:PAS domain-containing protein